MYQYQDLMRRAYYGTEKSDRTGTGTRSIFGHQMRFDLAHGFPIVTTKKVHFKSVVAELLWFLSGSTCVQDLRDMDCKIWNQWENDRGTIGPMYGAQWRGFTGHGVDQIANLVDELTFNPDSRRHIVSAWNVADLPDMALAPCHAMFQCYCEQLSMKRRETEAHWRGYEWKERTHDDLDALGIPRYRLSLQLYQRSADIFLGVPFNIASYALLTHMLAQQCNMMPGEFIWTGGDCHLYNNHLEQAKLQLSREPYERPRLAIKRKPDSIFDYKPDDFELVRYKHHPHISAPVAI